MNGQSDRQETLLGKRDWRFTFLWNDDKEFKERDHYDFVVTTELPMYPQELWQGSHEAVQKILIPTDASDNAQAAAARVLELAKPKNKKMVSVEFSTSEIFSLTIWMGRDTEPAGFEPNKCEESWRHGPATACGHLLNNHTNPSSY